MHGQQDVKKLMSFIAPKYFGVKIRCLCAKWQATAYQLIKFQPKLMKTLQKITILLLQFVILFKNIYVILSTI